MAAARSRIVDDFRTLSGWQVSTSGQARLSIARDKGPSGVVMRLDYDFDGGGGFVVVRKQIALTLPEAYAFRFQIRGKAPVNHFEFKLSDPSSRNVWWYRQPDYQPPVQWRQFRIRSADISFAWGPNDGSLKQVGTIEFAIAAGTGGKGTLWIDDLRLEDETYRLKPTVRASSSKSGFAPGAVVDNAPETSWRAAHVDGKHEWLLVDFLRERDYGAMVIDWVPGAFATRFSVEASNDGKKWHLINDTPASYGNRSYVYLPGIRSRYVRLNMLGSDSATTYGITGIQFKPHEYSRTINQFFQSLAHASPRGYYPRYLIGEQCFWTTVGKDANKFQSLLSEDGVIEPDKGGFSIEPFIATEGKLINWADVETEQSLEDDYLPIPTVTWRAQDLALQISPFVADVANRPVLFVRYRLENKDSSPRTLALYLTLRPFQVTPPWQNLEELGGVKSIKDISLKDGAVWIDKNRPIVSLSPMADFGAHAFAQGRITDFLEVGAVPPAKSVSDAFGYASGVMRYDVNIGANGYEDTYIALPVDGLNETDRSALAEILRADGGRLRQLAVRGWADKLNGIHIDGPPEAEAVVRTLKTATAHILINRDGPAIHAGPRRYARSWIRDGAVSATGLLALGFDAEVKDYLRWYAQFQAESGNIPCCVDRHGADWLPEYDSLGQFIYAVMEHYRFTRDEAFLREMWPSVTKAIGFLESLRGQRLSPAYQEENKRLFFGLLPESASHEGYLSHPVHAYWDDFWAMRGIKDALAMAVVQGDPGSAVHLLELRDGLRKSLGASIRAAMQQFGIRFIPGSADLGDFDATATAVAVLPIEEHYYLPADAVAETFNEYYRRFLQRHNPTADWSNFSAYELRVVASLIHLGQRERAYEVLQYFMNDRIPRAWHQWSEITWRDRRSPAYIGDLPHTWIGAEFVRSARSMFLYESDAGPSLIVAAGIPAAWLVTGVTVSDMITHFGKLSYRLQREGEHSVRLALWGDVQIPAGKIIVRPPVPGRLHQVTVNGQPVPVLRGVEAIVDSLPADVVFEY